MKTIFSVLDTKAGVFSTPFFHVNVATATRDFGHAVNSPGTELNRYPSDYVLVQLGTFEEETGVIEIHKPLHIGTAAQFINSINEGL